jgi:hypothetical protein
VVERNCLFKNLLIKKLLDGVIQSTTNKMKSLYSVFFTIISIIILGSIVSLFINKTKEATHIDDAVQNYEQFQEIYNTCSKLNTDLCVMQDLPESDKMFEQFSKIQRVTTLKGSLNKWIEEYNSKSKMFGRNLWKSKSLPVELNVNQYPCYK